MSELRVGDERILADTAASRLFAQHQQLHKHMTQENVRNELVNQAFEKMVQNNQERVGETGHKEFTLNRANYSG